MGVIAFVSDLVFVLAIFLPTPGLPFDPRGDSGVKVNQGSHGCLGCHDGTLATNIIGLGFNGKAEIFLAGAATNSYLDGSHPVGIDYRQAQLRSRGRLKDPSLLDPAVKLENGQVVCTSCHDPDSQLRAKLVMRNTGSRLCFSCHNL
ncbi:MAG: cytochrome c3 family protein [Candidatus Binatia bacterium]